MLIVQVEELSSSAHASQPHSARSDGDHSVDSDNSRYINSVAPPSHSEYDDYSHDTGSTYTSMYTDTSAIITESSSPVTTHSSKQPPKNIHDSNSHAGVSSVNNADCQRSSIQFSLPSFNYASMNSDAFLLVPHGCNVISSTPAIDATTDTNDLISTVIPIVSSTNLPETVNIANSTSSVVSDPSCQPMSALPQAVESSVISTENVGTADTAVVPDTSESSHGNHQY